MRIIWETLSPPCTALFVDYFQRKFYGAWFSYCIFLSFSAEKLRLQEELFRLRSYRKDGEARKEHLLNRAKLLQARAASHKQKVIFFCFFTQPLKINFNKKLDRRQKTTQTFNIDAQGFRKTKHENLLTWEIRVNS